MAKYKILNTQTKSGIAKSTGNPYTKVTLLLQEEDGNQIKAISFDPQLVTLEGQIVEGYTYEKEYNGKVEINFKWAGSTGAPQQAQPKNNAGPVILKKLDEILGILKANFPTAIEMSDSIGDDEETKF